MRGAGDDGLDAGLVVEEEVDELKLGGAVAVVPCREELGVGDDKEGSEDDVCSHGRVGGRM